MRGSCHPVSSGGRSGRARIDRRPQLLPAVAQQPAQGRQHLIGALFDLMMQADQPVQSARLVQPGRLIGEIMADRRLDLGRAAAGHHMAHEGLGALEMIRDHHAPGQPHIHDPVGDIARGRHLRPVIVEHDPGAAIPGRQPVVGHMAGLHIRRRHQPFPFGAIDRQRQPARDAGLGDPAVLAAGIADKQHLMARHSGQVDLGVKAGGVGALQHHRGTHPQLADHLRAAPVGADKDMIIALHFLQADPVRMADVPHHVDMAAIGHIGRDPAQHQHRVILGMMVIPVRQDIHPGAAAPRLQRPGQAFGQMQIAPAMFVERPRRGHFQGDLYRVLPVIEPLVAVAQLHAAALRPGQRQRRPGKGHRRAG